LGLKKKKKNFTETTVGGFEIAQMSAADFATPTPSKNIQTYLKHHHPHHTTHTTHTARYTPKTVYVYVYK
jgi:hypothetical protein